MSQAFQVPQNAIWQWQPAKCILSLNRPTGSCPEHVQATEISHREQTGCSKQAFTRKRAQHQPQRRVVSSSGRVGQLHVNLDTRWNGPSDQFHIVLRRRSG